MVRKKKYYIRNYNKYAVPLEKRFTLILRAFLIKQSKRIAKKLVAYTRENKADETISEKEATKRTNNIIDKFIDWEEENFELLNIMTALWIQSGMTGNDLANDLFYQEEDRILYGVIEDKYTKFLKKYGAKQVTYVNKTTKEEVKKQLVDGLTAGDSYSTIADNIVKNTQIKSKSRAINIAETEIHNTLNAGEFMNGEAGGFYGKEYVNMGDGAVRDNAFANHVVLGGQIRKLNETFSNGGMYPGDTLRLGKYDIIRCRCTYIFLTREEYEDRI